MSQMQLISNASKGAICENSQYSDEQINEIVEDSENIPYHTREEALPFSYGTNGAYGTLPDGVKLTELNRMKHQLNDARDGLLPIPAADKPLALRKSTRPLISASPPVLRKTPSREEFEEMLMERREKVLNQEKNKVVKIAQNASIQKDLDELHEKLNKKGLLNAGDPNRNNQMVVVVNEQNDDNSMSPKRHASPEFTDESLVAPNARPQTPSFPVALMEVRNDRSASPYPFISNKNEDVKCTEFNDAYKVEPLLTEFWYKPNLSRENACEILRDAQPGTFFIRKSTTYNDAFGLVLRVAKPPSGCGDGAQKKDVLVRHFLLELTPNRMGVHLKGCVNEPVFTSLAAFVHEHSTKVFGALPIKLIIPKEDLLAKYKSENADAQKQLLKYGAACNVMYLGSFNMENLTGEDAIRKSVDELYGSKLVYKPIEVHFKVSQNGVTLTDNKRLLFFRRHYILHTISYFGIDSQNRCWRIKNSDNQSEQNGITRPIFGFVAQLLTGKRDNECHLFTELTDVQPASAIVSFAQKILPLSVLD